MCGRAIFAPALTGYLLNNTTAAIGGVTTALITGLLVIIFLYFLLGYGREWVSRLTVLIPLDARISTNILRTVHSSVVANVNGVLAAVIGQGVLLASGSGSSAFGHQCFGASLDWLPSFQLWERRWSGSRWWLRICSWEPIGRL